MDIGIKLTFMLFIDCKNTAMSSEYDVIYKMSIAHNSTKVSIIP